MQILQRNLSQNQTRKNIELLILKNPKIYFLFLKDLIGLTALQIFFDYGGENKNDVNKKSKNLNKIKFILQMSYSSIDYT